MMPYDEALKVWASRRFGIPLEEISVVELEDVPVDAGVGFYHPAHVDATIRTNTPTAVGTDIRSIPGSLAAVIYEVVHAGMED